MALSDQERDQRDVTQRLLELASQSAFRALVSDCLLGLAQPDSIKAHTSARLQWMRLTLKLHAARMSTQETLKFQREVYGMLLSKTLTDLQSPGMLQDLVVSRLPTSQNERVQALKQLFSKHQIPLIEDSTNTGGYSRDGSVDESSGNFGIVEKDADGALSIKMSSKGLEDAEEIEHELITLYSIRSAIESLPDEIRTEVVKKPLNEIRENEIFLQSGIIISIVEVILDILSHQIN